MRLHRCEHCLEDIAEVIFLPPLYQRKKIVTNDWISIQLPNVRGCKWKLIILWARRDNLLWLLFFTEEIEIKKVPFLFSLSAVCMQYRYHWTAFDLAGLIRCVNLHNLQMLLAKSLSPWLSPNGFNHIVYLLSVLSQPSWRESVCLLQEPDNECDWDDLLCTTHCALSIIRHPRLSVCVTSHFPTNHFH